MQVELSINNRQEVMTLPVTPEELIVDFANSTSIINSINYGDLKLIGKKGLKNITLESFFPSQNYSFLQVSTTKTAIEYVKQIEKWINWELPIRLIITDDDTILNDAFAIESFSYTIKQDKDIYYTLSLQEFKLL